MSCCSLAPKNSNWLGHMPSLTFKGMFSIEVWYWTIDFSHNYAISCRQMLDPCDALLWENFSNERTCHGIRALEFWRVITTNWYCISHCPISREELSLVDYGILQKSKIMKIFHFGNFDEFHHSTLYKQFKIDLVIIGSYRIKCSE